MTSIDLLFDGVEWKPTGLTDADSIDGLPYATHEGVLHIGSSSLNVVVLNTGQRVITKESLNAFFGDLG